MKLNITILINLIFCTTLSAQNIRTSNSTSTTSKQNLTLAIGETVLIGDAKKMIDIDKIIFNYLSGYIGKENLVSLKNIPTSSKLNTNQKAFNAKYLVFFTIAGTKNQASISSMIYEQSTMNIIATNMHRLYDLPNGLDKVKRSRILNRHCINLKTMMLFNEAYPDCDKNLIQAKWEELDEESKKQNKNLQKEIYDQNAETLGDTKVKVPKVISGTPTDPKVIDVTPTMADDDIIKNLSDDDRNYYQQKADAENKTLIVVIKEAKAAENNSEIKNPQKNELEERAPKPDLTKKFEDLTKEELEEINAIAKFLNITLRVAFEEQQKDGFMIFLNDGNWPNSLLDLSLEEQMIFTDRSKFWEHTNDRMLKSLREIKDYYINLKKKSINTLLKNVPKNSPLAALEKFGAKFNPGMISVYSNVDNAEIEDISIAHKSNCDNFVIVGGSITLFQRTTSSKYGNNDKKIEIKINVTGNNTAFADCLYSNKEEVVIGGLTGKKVDEQGIKKEKIQLYFQYTDDNFYEIKFSNLGFVVFGTATESGMTEDLGYYKDLAEDYKITGNFTCSKSDRFLTIAGGTTNPTLSETKPAVSKTNDKVLEAIAESGGLKDLEGLTNDMKKDFGIKTDYKVQWNLKLQRVSAAIGKVKDVEIGSNGNVIKDNTLNNAPKLKIKTKPKNK